MNKTHDQKKKKRPHLQPSSHGQADPDGNRLNQLIEWVDEKIIVRSGDANIYETTQYLRPIHPHFNVHTRWNLALHVPRHHHLHMFQKCFFLGITCFNKITQLRITFIYMIS